MTEVTEDSAFTYAISEKSFENKSWLFFISEDKNKPLYNYVGGIFYLNNDSFQTIVCANETLGKQKSKRPELINNKLVCGKGTKEIK